MRQYCNDFRPKFGLNNPHIQTIYSSLLRRKLQLNFTIERFTLSDGDFLEAFWLQTNQTNKQKPLVILFHGLAGSFESPYIQATMQELSKAGFESVLMHFRGCSGVDNLLARSYHSGDTADAKEFLQSLHQRFPERKLYSVGFSLGANMLLKLLAEMQEKSLLKKAIAISAPMLLDNCATRMDQGISKYYQYRLLQDLKSSLLRKFDKHDMQTVLKIKREDVTKIRTFWEFDALYTAPIHGFDSAEEYYAKSSARQYLKQIQTPTLIIHAKDDPFMTPDMIPQQAELSSTTTLELYNHGGHVGFVGGSFFRPYYWLEKRIAGYFLA